MTRICTQLNQTQCCDFAWDETCALAASQVCIPEVRPMYNDELSCPLGFVCNEDLTQKSLCSEIRQIPQKFFIGDVFAGVYCPEGKIGMENCPRGKYCPNPEEQLNCPAGYFCPYKTATPQISCPGCGEGATALERDIGLQVVLTLLVVFIIIGTVSMIVYKRTKHLLAKQVEVLSYRLVGENSAKIEKQKQNQLDKLRPKLAVIAKRLEGMSNDDSGCNSNLIRISKTDGDKEKLEFDARGIFDALDTNNDGDLQYAELNAVLGFDDEELEVFVASMNKAADAKEITSTKEDSVSRPVFVNNFLKALEGTVNLKVSPAEAAAIYDNILKDNQAKEVEEGMLYTSVLSNILSDYEIMLLIKKFRQLNSMDEEAPSSNRHESRRSGVHRRYSGITREVFVLHYPTLLMQVYTENDHVDNSNGVDICFKDLCLEVTVAKKEINVVNNVTGRLQAKTMTALMGGSGAGKTSLLNALCGRAYYGNIIGDTYINGTKKQIEEIKDVIGFVPQDDVVYAELTVRENLVFAGKLSLPRGTAIDEIEDLADSTLANLGLSRVANSLVGDVKRRGVSGGEKKRVNIGLELMSRPKCLFLDEPTSGLDSSSALLVMSSLKNLVSSEGVTIVTVIHQPRKFIFDLFDCLVLLGVGGNTVYSGPAKGAYNYFSALDYVLPAGEALADWLIDISAGQIHPDPKVAATKAQERDKDDNDGEKVVAITPRVMTEAVGKKGIAMGKAKEAITDAALRREWLYKEWKKYFDGLDSEQKLIYEVPPVTKVPGAKERQSFSAQLVTQLRRCVLVSYRNLASKMVDTIILIVAAVVISLVSGLPEITRADNPSIEFESLVSFDQKSAPGIVAQLFKYAATIQQTYPLQIGLITAVLVGLQTSRILTSKQLEFFREASSGYDSNAYLLAVNIMATVETSIQILMVALISAMLREPIARWDVFVAHFLVMAWTVVSWSLLFPMIMPADNVSTVLGAFFAFFGLLLSGAIPPINFEAIYKGDIVEHLAAWLSVTRFFLEGLAASEHRCLPEQSGWTVSTESINFDRSNTLMAYNRFSYARHDPNATIYDCGGWYWGILPSIFVGITVRYLGFLAMHGFNRGKQTKKPIVHEIGKDRKCGILVLVLFLGFVALAALTTWLYTHDYEPDYEFVGVDKWAQTGLEQNLTALMQTLNLTDLNASQIPNLLEMNENLNVLALSREGLPTGEFPSDDTDPNLFVDGTVRALMSVWNETSQCPCSSE
ncbi:unnamed protein product [Cylindrotheca closterium]|uniref:Uncharacterized protein n=1 Tax=Cylindrotheca closterium TaxID=2856 RepID=A0AAD2FPJ6_9STRA|nr:unnamed protein product [Cylindrotheca closterium]